MLQGKEWLSSYAKVKQGVRDGIYEIKIPKSHRQYAAAFAFFQPCYAEEKEHFKFTTINLILIELSFSALFLSHKTILIRQQWHV